MVPLDSLSGEVDIIGSVTENGRNVANFRDKMSAGPDAAQTQWQTAFILDPGAYTCRLLVRETSNGQIYTESIAFEVK
jgi:hypothetical protein